MLSTRELTVQFGGVKALNSINITVDDGALVGLIGPNGAGKTTFIDAVTGFVQQRAGGIEFDGNQIERWGAARRSLAGLRRTFQGVELFEDMTVLENVMVAAEPNRWYSAWIDALMGSHRGGPVEECHTALETIGVNHLSDRLPTEISHGQQRLVSVARSIVGSPKLVLLDEPAAGLDSTETLELGHKIEQLRKSGLSILLVDHDTNLVFTVCDFVYVMDFGQIIASGTPTDVRAQASVIEAYLGGTDASEQQDVGAHQEGIEG
jgi:branched-chain amino acid transport system ATP-binding protein